MRRCVILFVVLSLVGCAPGQDDRDQAKSAPLRSAATDGGGHVDEGAFWQIVEDVQSAAGGDSEEIAAELKPRFADADDEILRAFQHRLVAASTRLYTWQHHAAAEMICGFVSDDVFRTGGRG